MDYIAKGQWDSARVNVAVNKLYIKNNIVINWSIEFDWFDIVSIWPEYALLWVFQFHFIYKFSCSNFMSGIFLK